MLRKYFSQFMCSVYCKFLLSGPSSILHCIVLYCIVLFRQLPCLYMLMGIVPSLIGSVYVYMYAVDSPKRQEEAMNTGSQSPSSFRLVSWFILRADRDTGPTA